MSEVQFFIEVKPESKDDKILKEGIISFNHQILKEKATHFSVFAKNHEEIIGGALVWEHSDALYIDTLWLMENYREQGIGSTILSMIEKIAIEKKLNGIFVDTYEFQAQEFYKKHGYSLIGIIPKYLLGYSRLFMKKDI